MTAFPLTAPFLLRRLRPPSADFAPSSIGSFIRRGGWGKVSCMSTEMYHPFPNTHWSLVHRAGATGTEAAQDRREAMAVLLVRYEPALRSYLKLVRRMGDEADDILQAFVADKFLERDMLRHADEGRGRFRTFLLTSLNNFVTSWHRAAGSRGGLKSVGSEPDDKRPSREKSPSAIVEAAWARALVRDVITTMREKCLTDGREDVWGVFEGRVLAEIFNGTEPVPYEVLAEKLALRSPTQAANLLVTAKRLYARLLRVAVSEYERDEANIEAEIADLRASLARAGETE